MGRHNSLNLKSAKLRFTGPAEWASQYKKTPNQSTNPVLGPSRLRRWRRRGLLLRVRGQGVRPAGGGQVPRPVAGALRGGLKVHAQGEWGRAVF